MKIPPSYQLTKKITSLLQEIEKLSAALNLLPQTELAEKYTRQKNLLKSSVYSARIEGNQQRADGLSLSSFKDPKTKGKLEIANLYQALELVISRNWQRKITRKDLKKLHHLVMKGFSSESGFIRQEPSAIFNMAGVAIYLCPMPEDLPDLLDKFFEYLNKDVEEISLVRIGIIHYLFERIHPFLDGNGRVGRLLIHLTLKKYGYDFRGLVSIEEYLDKQRQEYYHVLQSSQQDISPFLELFLQALVYGLNQAVSEKERASGEKDEDSLPPRRYEILQVIRDHRQVSFDFIRRRFLAVNPRMLRYDLKRLRDKGLIKKRGVTKGVVYEPIEN